MSTCRFVMCSISICNVEKNTDSEKASNESENQRDIHSYCCWIVNVSMLSLFWIMIQPSPGTIINRTSLTSQMLCVQKRPLWWTSPAAPLSKASTAQLLQQQRHNPSAHNRTHKTIVINILLSVSVSVAEFPLMIYNPTFNHIYFKWNCTEHRPAVIQPDVISSSLCENSPEEWRSHDRPLSGSSCVVLMQLY